jgi:negative regulator of replication initiation
MKTERMTVLVTAEQKAAINAQAQSMGVSAGEMVRRAVETYASSATGSPNDSEAVLNALADELFSAAKTARAALKAANKEVRTTIEQLAKSRGAVHGGV